MQRTRPSSLLLQARGRAPPAQLLARIGSNQAAPPRPVLVRASSGRRARSGVAANTGGGTDACLCADESSPARACAAATECAGRDAAGCEGDARSNCLGRNE